MFKLKFCKTLLILINALIFSLVFIEAVGLPGDLNDNLTAYFNMDEGTGILSQDIHSNNNNGTLVNGLGWTTAGKINNATGDYDDSNDFINISTNDDFMNFTHDQKFTISMWVNWTSNSGENTLIGRSTGLNGWFIWMTNSTAGLEFYYITVWTSNVLSVNTPEPSFDVWHHIVFVNDGTSDANGVRFYIDNVSASLTTGFDGLTGSSHPVTVGKIGTRNGAQMFKGRMDEVAVWTDRNLTVANINTLWNNGNAAAYDISAADPCACPAINNDWLIDMSLFCNITSDCNLGTGRLNFTGTGITRFNATIDTTNMGWPGSGAKLIIQDQCRINIA